MFQKKGPELLSVYIVVLLSLYCQIVGAFTKPSVSIKYLAAYIPPSQLFNNSIVASLKWVY